jgi:hypothetical protein
MWALEIVHYGQLLDTTYSIRSIKSGKGVPTICFIAFSSISGLYGRTKGSIFAQGYLDQGVWMQKAKWLEFIYFQ